MTGGWAGELTAKTMNGQTFPVLVTSSPVAMKLLSITASEINIPEKITGIIIKADKNSDFTGTLID